MTMHFWLMLLILIITAGVILIQILLRLYRNYRAPYLKSTLFFTGAYMIEFLFIFALFYIAVNLPELWTLNRPGILSHLFSLSPKLFGLVYFYYLVKTIRDLQGHKISSGFKLVMALFFLLIPLNFYLIQINTQITPLHDYVLVISNLSFLAFNPWLIILLVPLFARSKKTIAPQVARPFAALFLFRQIVNQSAILTLFYLEYRNVEQVKTLSVVFHTFYVALTFILMFRWLKRSVIPFHRDQVGHTVTGAALGSIRKRYKLSRRESEVALQIVYGKSNKEIAVLLDLSTSTVKNYIYSMYQKIDINSRFELINLIQNISNPLS